MRAPSPYLPLTYRTQSTRKPHSITTASHIALANQILRLWLCWRAVVTTIASPWRNRSAGSRLRPLVPLVTRTRLPVNLSASLVLLVRRHFHLLHAVGEACSIW